MPKIRKCIVRGCLPGERKRNYFLFPKNRELQNRWRENLRIGRDAHLAPLHSYVCSDHFGAAEVGAKKLKKGAVPTLNLGFDDVEGIDDVNDIAPVFNIREENKARSCCIEGCPADDSKIVYSFPKSEAAFNAWALACNLKPPYQTSNKAFICERHFEKKYVSKKRLCEGAFPKLHLSQQQLVSGPNSTSSEWVLQPVQKTYLMPKVSEDLTLEEFEEFSKREEKKQRYDVRHVEEGLDESHSFCNHEPFAEAARAYQSNANKQTKKYQELEIEYANLEKKYLELERRAIVASKNASEDAINFARMIVSTINTYTDVEKDLAQNINYMSTKAYNFMRDELKFALPHKKSLLRWRPIRFVRPGLDCNVLDNLKKTVSEMSDQERICQIIFDEIAIKSDLCYNKSQDLIDGFVDSGGTKRAMKIGDKCCFFMIKALAASWKYVLSYHVAKGGVPVGELRSTLLSNIEEVEKIGLNVKAIVCDQGPINVRLLKDLNVTEANPFIVLNEKKIFCLYDYCHLTKSVRNNLLKHDLKTADGIASFKVIRKLYAIDKDNTSFKICPKLTSSHIYPNSFEKMSVSRATQVLSNAVAAGIEMASSQGLLGDDPYTLNCVKPTQKFIKRMNDLFDELDCKFLKNKNPLKCPIWRGSEAKLERVMDHADFLSSVQLPNNIRAACFSGFSLTIKAMVELSKDVFENYPGMKFILLGKLNQDALENFFYKIRANLGINTHPSAHEIQYIVARLISMKILRRRFEKKGSNCEDDDDINLDWNMEEDDNASVHLEPVEQLAIEDVHIPDEEFAEDEGKSAEIQVQRYYAGYSIYQKLLHKSKCANCAKVMVKTPGELSKASEALIRSKSYTVCTDLRLVNPEDRVFEVCRFQMSWYKTLFKEYAHVVGVQGFIVNAIAKKTKQVFPEWFGEAGECLEHRQQLLNSLITVLLFKNAKWLAEEKYIANQERLKANKLKKLRS